MPWRGPPVDVIRAVEAELGAGYYEGLSKAWNRVAAIDPSLLRERTGPGQPGLIQWYRSPQEILAERALQPDIAALLSQHGLGLAVDVRPTEGKRAEVIAEAKRQGFFVRTYKQHRGVHIAALSDEDWRRRTTLQRALRLRLEPLLAARE